MGSRTGPAQYRLYGRVGRQSAMHPCWPCRARLPTGMGRPPALYGRLWRHTHISASTGHFDAGEGSGRSTPISTPHVVHYTNSPAMPRWRVSNWASRPGCTSMKYPPWLRFAHYLATTPPSGLGFGTIPAMYKYRPIWVWRPKTPGCMNSALVWSPYTSTILAACAIT